MQRPHISKQQLPVLSVRTTESVNDKCHTWRGRLDKRGGLILSFPRIVAVYWDPFFGTARNAARINQFFRDVGKTAWFHGQGQFGVRPPAHAGQLRVRLAYAKGGIWRRLEL